MINFQLKRECMQDLTLLIPITNIFEIFYIEINGRPFRFENLKIFELKALEEKVMFESQVDRARRGRHDQTRRPTTPMCPICTRPRGCCTRRSSKW